LLEPINKAFVFFWFISKPEIAPNSLINSRTCLTDSILSYDGRMVRKLGNFRLFIVWKLEASTQCALSNFGGKKFSCNAKKKGTPLANPARDLNVIGHETGIILLLHFRHLNKE